MLKALARAFRAPRTDEQIAADFRGFSPERILRGPWRCGMCRQMQPDGARLAMVAGECCWPWFNDDYDAIVAATRSSSSQTGVCFDCLRRR
jgi:hypothetical protein